MPHLLQPIVNYIHLHPNIGALLAFMIAFAESLPLIGTIIPGSVTMTAVGTLIGTGVLPGFNTLIWASLGAFIGDTIGFSIGYLFNERLRNVWPFKKYPHWLEHSEAFFEKHGGKSIIIGRFFGPARSTVPLVAGLLKMTWPRFILAAIPSAIMWAVIYTIPGILIGALAVELPPHVATEFLLIGVIVIVALWLVFWAIQYFFSQLARMINIWIDKLWDILICHKPSRPFIRLIAVKGRPTDHYQLTLSILFLIFSLTFLFIFYSVVNSTWLTAANQPILHLLQSLRTRAGFQFFLMITLFVTPIAMFTAGIIASIGLALMRQWRAAIHLFAIDLLTSGAITIMKLIYHNPRPEGTKHVILNSSFPSGHTALTCVILSAFSYFTGKLIKPGYKWIPYTLAVILMLLVGISRIYLGAHWLTDILGSYTLGLSIVFFVIIFYRRRDNKYFQTINKPYWFSLMIISIAIPGIVWSARLYREEHHRYQIRWPQVQMTAYQWWMHPIKYLPRYRLNRFGKPIQPFNIEWLGSLPRIQSHLAHQGWNVIDAKYTVKGTLQRFMKKKQPYHLPLFPWLYQHKPPRLILMKPTKDGKSYSRVERRNVSIANIRVFVAKILDLICGNQS